MTEPAIVDPSGDLTVHARGKGHQKTFIVSPKLAIHVWREMLNRTGLGEENRMDLTGDNPDALLIMLRISYLQFSEVP